MGKKLTEGDFYRSFRDYIIHDVLTIYYKVEHETLSYKNLIYNVAKGGILLAE